MKKQLLFNFTKFLSQKRTFRIAAFAILTLLSVQTSFAQKWNVIGQDNEISTVASSYTTIIVLGDVPYVSYVESSPTGSGIGKVKKKNSSTGVWEQVGGDIAANISYSRIYSDKTGKLYVTYVDNANGSKLAVATYNTTSSTWETVGGTGVFVSDGSVTHALSQYTMRSDLAFDSNNVAYVTFAERAITVNPVTTVTTVQGAYVKRFNGTSWVAVGSATGLVSADTWTVGNAIALDQTNVPYVVYIKQASTGAETAGILNAYRLNLSNVWESLAIPVTVSPGTYIDATPFTGSGSSVGARHSTITMDSDNNPMVTITSTNDSNKTTVFRYTKSTNLWDYLGNVGTRDGSRVTLTNGGNGNVFVIYHDALLNGGRSNTIRVFKRIVGTVGRTDASFSELVNTPITSLSGVGIEAAGVNQSAAYVAPAGLAISNVAIAVGTNANSPYIVYTKNLTNGGLITPIVRVFDPLVLSAAATAITETTATAGGEVLVTAPAAGTITERGIVYAVTPNPTTAVTTKVVDGATTTGVFTGSITGLTAATNYYARAYFIYTDAITSVVTTVYGDNKRFTTAAAPLATDSFEKSDMVKAYPNPTTDSVTVSLPNAAVVKKIAVYNSLGQLVRTEAKDTVSLQNLANGNYYLTIYTAEGNYSKKIIKK